MLQITNDAAQAIMTLYRDASEPHQLLSPPCSVVVSALFMELISPMPVVTLLCGDIVRRSETNFPGCPTILTAVPLDSSLLEGSALADTLQTGCLRTLHTRGLRALNCAVGQPGPLACRRIGPTAHRLKTQVSTQRLDKGRVRLEC